LLTYVLVIGIGVLTYKPTVTGTWLLALILLLIPVRIILSILILPWREKGRMKGHMPFILWYLTCFLVLLGYSVIFGGSSVLLGVAKSDIREFLQTISSPLGLLHPAFWLTSAKSFSDFWGILLGVNFFYAFGMFFVYSVVHHFLRRSRTTEINIAGTKDPEEDEL
jgi:hypothetical protein